MAKRVPEPCLFCGTAPCTCNTGTSATKPASKIKHKGREVKDAPISNTDLLGAATKTRFQKHEVERDLNYEAALSALRPILHPTDQRWVDSQLEVPVSAELEKRLIGWKERNGRLD